MKFPKRYFRAGVGAVITDGDGRVLVGERRGISGAWQFPQGGIEDGEEPLDALFREIEEEIGIPRRELRLLGRFPEPLAVGFKKLVYRQLAERFRSTVAGARARRPAAAKARKR